MGLRRTTAKIMLAAMTSPTQRRLTIEQVTDAAHKAFGVEARSATQLSGGSFGSVFRIDLLDGRAVVAKSAPEPSAGLLTYEAGMIAEEANYLRLAGPVDGVPTAELLYVDDDFVFMSLLPGVALSTMPESAATNTIREESGAALAKLHAVTGDFYGYAGPRPRGDTWPDAFAAMIEALIQDAAVWDVQLPVPADDLRSVLAANRDVLAAVTRPALVHFDLWDGNVLALDGHLSGLVDGERYFFGDPMVDFASPALFRDMTDEPEHPFLRGYRAVRPITIDAGVRRRVWLCQLYLYLLMVVEYPSRGMNPAEDPQRWDLICDLVRTRVARLR
jgi:Ser/Thr protein kinase RdoA (MazF antagonist)